MVVEIKSASSTRGLEDVPQLQKACGRSELGDNGTTGNCCPGFPARTFALTPNCQGGRDGRPGGGQGRGDCCHGQGVDGERGVGSCAVCTAIIVARCGNIKLVINLCPCK